MTPPLHLILLAGGQGTRVGGPEATPKQFRRTGCGLLFGVSLREFAELVASVTVVAPQDWHDTVAGELAELLTVPWQLATPGATRTASTWQGTTALTQALSPAGDDLVAVHDAARPFATKQLLLALAAAATGTSGAAIPAVPVPDTVVQSTAGVAVYLDRESLLAVQTPQVFRWELLVAAHQQAYADGVSYTDDGGLVAAGGHLPVVVPGEPGNWKVTTASDWQRALLLLAE